ncbi:OmpA family protein [Massilia sp. MB5]|uniref:OmpA family protein n=1 Tax=Massilia sp. MB5 TaxID=2919578 RepID=UPI001F0D56C8|nr:OmpA family protein [Massilia sp. MB5]UMR30421.1 OmpA family protein [Massilia sp. MB5]
MRYFMTLILVAAACARGQTPVPAADPGGPGAPVLVSGTVPDESSKAALMQRLRQLYGNERVIDQLTIGVVSLPPNWMAQVQRLMIPALKLVSKGQLSVDGQKVAISGEVASETQRQQIAGEMTAGLQPSYSMNSSLHVAAAEQQLLDATLANRIIEFESGQAVIRASGMQILDEMSAALQKVKNKHVEVIGHTDNTGQREANLRLSLARAEAVRLYLSAKGINAAMIAVSGHGPDRPVADNADAAGRARNRRIEFHVVD